MESGKDKILVRDELLKQKDGTRVIGYVLLGNYSKQPTKNGSFFMAGAVECVGQMQFKSWSNSNSYSSLDMNDLSGNICYVDAKVNEYQGIISLVIDSIKAVNAEEIGIKKEDFLASKYNADKFFTSLSKTLYSNIDNRLFNLFTAIVDGLGDRGNFLYEFGAVSHHDNVKSGLLAHTTKVCKIASIIKMYPFLSKKIDKNLLYFGCAVHDIGKTIEYSMGTVSETGKLISHNIIGVLILQEYKEQIVGIAGDEFFTRLLSIVSQHHGEYGDPPRTIEAYVIHLIDQFEANLTTLDQKLEMSGNEQILFNNFKLS